VEVEVEAIVPLTAPVLVQHQALVKLVAPVLVQHQALVKQAVRQAVLQEVPLVAKQVATL
jgi:hypothetical protein